MNQDYYPHNWVVIKITEETLNASNTAYIEGRAYYKVLAGWSGGYLQGDSWRLNSGINLVFEHEDDYYEFHGHSGSVYRCHKDTYGLRMNNAGIFEEMQLSGSAKVELMPEDTDWTNIKWAD
tara:strand:- start:360 stop:725 length:366 start_codon:yes stop_codon:yes gene_type:complete